MKNKKSKKSQITIFVIIALTIIAVIALAVMLTRETQLFKPAAVIDPQTYLKSCISNALGDAEKKVMDGNGYLNATNNYILFSLNRPKEKVPYLCRATRFYIPCINQEPMFVNHIKNEIANITGQGIDKCFKNMVDILAKEGYNVKENRTRASEVILSKDFISLDPGITLSLEKDDKTTQFEDFTTEINSPLYNLADTAEKISNYEALICEFDSYNWMKYHTNLLIKRFVAGDQTKIYTIQDLATEKQIDIAIKSCALPAGIN